MTKRNTEWLMYSLAGYSRILGVRTYLCAIDVMSELMFERGIPWKKIVLQRDVYPKVAEKCNRGESVKLINRRMGCMTKFCWKTRARNMLADVMGEDPDKLQCPRTKDFLAMVTYYVRYDEPYLEVLDDMKTL